MSVGVWVAVAVGVSVGVFVGVLVGVFVGVRVGVSVKWCPAMMLSFPPLGSPLSGEEA